MSGKEANATYEIVNMLWKSAKKGDNTAKFCIEYAGFVFSLIKGDCKTEEYWQHAVEDLCKLANQYGGSDSVEAEWGRLIVRVADEYRKTLQKGKSN